MPAKLYAFVPEEQNLSNAEREQLIEGLERELDEYYEQKCGKGSLETYLIQNEIWHLSEINYQVRAGYQKYLREYYVDSTVRNYLLGIDRVKLRLIIEKESGMHRIIRSCSMTFCSCGIIPIRRLQNDMNIRQILVSWSGISG